MSAKMTREEADERALNLHRGTPDAYLKVRKSEVADELMAVQAETERRVVEKCCEVVEFAPDSFQGIGFEKYNSMRAKFGTYLIGKIRAAFPEAK